MTTEMPVDAASDVRAQNTRAEFMEFLYQLYGRHLPEHPMHCLFTGLIDQYTWDCGNYVVQEMCSSWSTKRETLLEVLEARGQGDVL